MISIATLFSLHICQFITITHFKGIISAIAYHVLLIKTIRELFLLAKCIFIHCIGDNHFHSKIFMIIRHMTDEIIADKTWFMQKSWMSNTEVWLISWHAFSKHWNLSLTIFSIHSFFKLWRVRLVSRIDVKCRKAWKTLIKYVHKWPLGMTQWLRIFTFDPEQH